MKQLEIPLTERRLTNGLRVVVNEDHSSPIVAVHVMYRAGSRDERPGKTGLAHLLEHLLFEGSENCPKGEFDRLLEQVGATNNGSTWLDRTNYYEVVPSHAVELALWLERERMGAFLPVLSNEMLEVQRSVVINERKQVCENRPYGLAHEKLHELVFPAGHPYSWPTIGYTADLEEMTLEDAREFYTRFYAPSNAVLVLAGDIDVERGFALAERYFGDLPGGKPSAPPELSTAAVGTGGGSRSMVLNDRVSFERIYQAWAVPGYGTRDWVVLDVLSYLLSDGESSRLQSALLRDKQIAQQSDSYLYPTRLAGIFGIVSTVRSGYSAEQLKAGVDDVLVGIRDRGVTEEEVTGAIRRARRDHLDGLSTAEGRAEDIAYAATVLDDPAAFARLLNDYPTVTPAEVQAVARRYLGADSEAVVTVIPAEEVENAA